MCLNQMDTDQISPLILLPLSMPMRPFTSFNIFIERDPYFNPSNNCTLPSSITNYKCTLWGSSVSVASVVNFGQNCGQF
ncbi:hypothetical protein BGZ60DRAFT_406483 [Tricladium varicosporioides]|nr:hypothetical protein BGZ60DRAFT_406483 [Hymenoscyphus varicosporioides]